MRNTRFWSGHFMRVWKPTRLYAVGGSFSALTVGVALATAVRLPLSVAVRLIAGRVPPALTKAAPAGVSTTLLPLMAYARYRYEVWFIRHVVEAIEE